MEKWTYHTIKSLRHDKSLVIAKSDKGSGVVILDNVNKMKTILGDISKFIQLSLVDLHNSTISIEVKFQKLLVKWIKSSVLPTSIADLIRPTGSIWPCLYGLPTTYEDNVPLRPILSMIGSSQHKVVKWLVTILQPVWDYYGFYCIKDSFSFLSFIQNYHFTNKLMGSFDISSLFTLCLLWILLIYVLMFYIIVNCHPNSIPVNIFIQLTKFAVMSVKLIFNDFTYRQTDGVSVVPPLELVLANIFWGFCKKGLLSGSEKPEVYFHYLDDTFCLFNSEMEADIFFTSINNVHSALKFTLNMKTNSSLPFLDVLVCRTIFCFLTSVHRKPTFTGLYPPLGLLFI